MTEAVVRGHKGMTSVKELRIVQDMLPPDFPAVRYAKRIPSTGPSGLAMFGVVGFMTFYGLYRVGKFNRYRRLVKAEKFASRATIVPYLVAESDRVYVEEDRRLLAEEAEIMKDVPGWKVGESVYHTKRFMPPAYDYLLMKKW